MLHSSAQAVRCVRVKQWRKLWGGVGGGIQQDSEIFAVEVGNFEGGIKTAMKKRVAVEKEKQRVSILNEQTKCSRSICNIFLSFCALTFLS